MLGRAVHIGLSLPRLFHVRFWRVSPLALLFGFCLGDGTALADPPKSRIMTTARICDMIDIHARANGLPRDFFARLIWKESRFDPDAVSPAGAEGIAQFMPGTAKMRKLKNSFDVTQALPASAKYLAELKTGFGNLGLAAAAYNAGETRVTRWLTSGGFLPLETDEYVLDIMGEPADNFSERSYLGTIRPLDPKRAFHEACRNMRTIYAQTIAMATIATKPWGVQVAGNFRRAAAIKQWQRVAGRFGKILKNPDPVVSRVRTPRGRRGIYAVRIGADDRATANKICATLRSAGGSCIVMRNR
ncbi:lytic transglycosylase domain-containing protein [Mesorhizobium sp. IMUNJ 23232]|uniref:lytic transglycosylase domain-containing protein n=1 Tax=Mesorhizobium sp. IMUNJ 23232 TaxID=3376064 RepID=UPI003794A4CC